MQKMPSARKRPLAKLVFDFWREQTRGRTEDVVVSVIFRILADEVVCRSAENRLDASGESEHSQVADQILSFLKGLAAEREEEEERRKREERERDAEEDGIDIEDDEEDEESGQDEGEPLPVKERQPSIPRWELNPEDEGEDEVDEMDDSDDAETVRIQAKPVKKRPRKNAKASAANGKDHPKTAKASGARTGKLAVKVGKGKGRQKPLQKRIKLMLSGTRSEQEEEDELKSEEDKNHEISHDFS